MGSHAGPKQKGGAVPAVPVADNPAPASVPGSFGSNRANARLFRLARAGGPPPSPLAVAPPVDELEREADRVADAVVRVPTPTAGPPEVTRSTSPVLRTKCAGCEEEELRREASGDGPVVAPPQVHDVLAAPGRPLDPRTRSFFEPRFGADFSGVRVHDDPAASAAAEAVRARAYAVGDSIVFAAGEYAPDTDAGRRLLAHELAHVVQEAGGLWRAPDDGPADAPAGGVTLPEITVYGDPHFYDKAKRGNQRVAQSPPFPGWPYDAELRQLWAASEYDKFADAVRDYQEDVMGDPPAKADGILGRNTATALRAKPRPSGTRTVGDVQKALSAGAALTGVDPMAHAGYVERAVAAVGAQGWGAPFTLKGKDAPDGQAAPTIPRELVSLGADPLAGQTVAYTFVVYKTRSDALAALRTAPEFNVAFYFGPGGYVFPTTVSATTAPRVVDAMTRLAEQEREDARAMAELAENVLWWYVGARFPVRIKAPAMAAEGAAALAGFSPAERAIIQEAKTILGSHQLKAIRDAYKAGTSVVVQVAGRTIQYEPGLPASGMTMFGENGFLIGREAFKSETELIKTILHELHRLTTSEVKASGASAAAVAAETDAAFKFAERAFAAAFR